LQRLIPKVLHRFNRAAWLTLAICLGAVLAVNHAFYLQARKLGEHQFEVSVKEVVQAIDERMRHHALILSGAAGLFNASNAVGQQTWQHYVESLQLDRHSQGVQALGYSEVMTPENLASRIQAHQTKGQAPFSVRPTGLRPLYSVIVYLAPMTERNQRAIGYDLLAEPSRGDAMRRAVDDGLINLSAKITLLMETDVRKLAGFLMFLPVFRQHVPLSTLQERWQALQGFVYMPLRAHDLMSGLLGERERPLQFQIYDGPQVTAPKADSLLFDSGSVTPLVAQSQAEPQWTTSRVISAYGRDWTVQFQSRPGIETAWLSHRNSALLVLGVGLSGLLALFVAVLNSRRQRAEAMAHEMTAELRSQAQALQASQQMLDVIVENIPAGVFVKDAQEFRYELVNRAWRQMHERVGQALIGKTVHEVFNQPLADHFAADDRRAFASGQVQVNEESRLRTPLGHERVLRTMTVSVRNEAGKTEYLLGIAMDITEQVAARTAAKESAQLMQAVFDNVADGIVTLNREGRVHSMNRAAELMFGYTNAEVQGQSIHLLAPQAYHSQLDEFFKRRFQSTTPGRIGAHQEVEGRGKDGRIFAMELAISSSTHQGAPLFIGLVRDISERKHNEQMKASFVSTVSHELRTPLTSINGALGLVCGGVLGDVSAQAKSMLNIAYKNSHRLTLLINDLLDLEKMAAGKMRLNLAVEELTPLVAQAIATADAYAQQHQVRLLLQAPSEPVRVTVDANRLLQVLGNFLSNAVKYSDPGGQVEVTVSVCPDDGVVRVQVTDHGPGVPLAFRGQIFQKFSQAESSDARGKGGSGLGLAISKELMERMNGLIGYESVPGQGASFHFVLPVWVASDLRPESKMPQTGAQGTEAARILVVEDHPAAANYVLTILQRAGYGVDVATTGAMALERVQAHHYVAITLDMVLPDQTGVALVRTLRARPALDGVPILVISTATEMGKLALQDEFFGMEWLSKPADEAQLLGILKRRLSATTPAINRDESYET
jgi:PAS domain S-box-containing protein